MTECKLKEFEIPRIVGHGCSFDENGAIASAPLSPRMIEIIQAGNSFPEVDGFDPHGNWTNHYRVWTNHGNMTYQNKNTGHISIARTTHKDCVNFQVRQIIVNQDGMFQRIEAQINCERDFPGSVKDWKTQVTCYDSAQCPMDDLSLDIAGKTYDSEVRMTVNGVEEIHSVKDPLLCQWLILDVLQRDRKELDTFTVLEHGLKFKKNHKLIIPTPAHKEATVDGGVLESTIQRGTGLLPWEYWQDQAGRVLYAFSGTVMVILDEDAPAKTDRLIEELVQRGHHYEY